MPARTTFNVGFGPSAAPKRRAEGSPMRLLLLGDFSGCGPRGAAATSALSKRASYRVDLDTLGQVFTRLGPRIPLPADLGTPTEMLAFESLDDFHPDKLIERVAIFERLRALRARLLDPATYDQAAEEWRAAELTRSAPTVAATPPRVGDLESDAGTLQRLLGAAPRTAFVAAPAASCAIDELIRRTVAPYIVPGTAPEQRVYLAAIDDAIGDHMRRLLHAPAFRALEMAWRGVQWLVSRVELNEGLQLHLLDVTRDELQSDVLAARDDLSRSGLSRALCRPDADDCAHWSLLVGLFSIGPGADDLDLLESLGAIAVGASCPMVAAAAPALFGCDSVADLPDPRKWHPLPADAAQRWSRLRRSSVAPWIGLVAPCVLLRLPYGKSTDAAERFEFEEQPGEPVHGTLLWGPGSLAIALLVGRAFAEGGWNLAPDPGRYLDDLPAYTFRRDGEVQLQPCAEAWVGERAGLALLDHGLMPLLSNRQAAVVRLMRIQSVADPPRPLAGLWG